MSISSEPPSEGWKAPCVTPPPAAAAPAAAPGAEDRGRGRHYASGLKPDKVGLSIAACLDKRRLFGAYKAYKAGCIPPKDILQPDMQLSQSDLDVSCLDTCTSKEGQGCKKDGCNLVCKFHVHTRIHPQTHYTHLAGCPAARMQGPGSGVPDASLPGGHPGPLPQTPPLGLLNLQQQPRLLHLLEAHTQPVHGTS
eukprot:1161382-Pelagomonas_calceolata.AAC.2